MDQPPYRIAFMTNTYLPFVGGVPLSVDLYYRHLRKLGLRVFVYAPEYAETCDDPEDVFRIASIRQFNKTDFSVPLPAPFRTALDFHIHKYDVVHVHHPFLLGEVGMALARENRLPLVFTYHTQYENYTHYVPLDPDVAARTVIRHSAEFANCCDLVIAPTRDIERTLRERGVETDIAVLPTGIEREKFAAGDGARFRRELGLSPDTPVILHVGRLAKEKNLDYLLDAVGHALEAVPKAHFVIVGSGNDSDALEAKANAMGAAADRIHFTGRRTGPALFDAYAAGDLFAFASQSETQGMVVAEAMAAGMPVAALDADGVRDVVRDGVNGRLLKQDAAPAAFGEALVSLLNDGGARNAAGDAARETAKVFDMPVLAAKLAEHYNALKRLPNHKLREETMSFGLIRNFFATVWDDFNTMIEAL